VYLQLTNKEMAADTAGKVLYKFPLYNIPFVLCYFIALCTSGDYMLSCCSMGSKEAVIN